MATGQYESFGFTEAKGSVPASVVIGANFRAGGGVSVWKV